MKQAPEPYEPFVRRRLGDRVRTLRKLSKLTAEEVADYVGFSTATLSKIENRKQGTKKAYMRLMVQLFKDHLEPGEDEVLMRWAAKSMIGSGNDDPYMDIVSSDFIDYHEAEGQAGKLRVCKTNLIFGPLQIDEYVRQQRLAASDSATDEELAKAVDFMRYRFSRIMDSQGPTVDVVLNEAAVRQLVGGAAVMKAQIRHLMDASQNPSVRLQVVPASAGAYAAQDTSFVILEEIPDLKELVFIEHDRRGMYLEGSSVLRYRDMFEQAEGLAMTTEETYAFLDRLQKNL